MPRRQAQPSFFDLLEDPRFQDLAAAFTERYIAPNVRKGVHAARRGFRFPACALSLDMLHRCNQTGVGVCQSCQVPFCVDHGLLLLAGCFDSEALVAEIERPCVGFCAPCADRALTALRGAGVPPPPRNPYQSDGPGGRQDGRGQRRQEQRRAAREEAASGSRGHPHPPRILTAYATLELAPNASIEMVFAAKKCLAKRHHPDVGGDPRRMVAINEAVSTLETYLGRKSCS